MSLIPQASRIYTLIKLSIKYTYAYITLHYILHYIASQYVKYLLAMNLYSHKTFNEIYLLLHSLQCISLHYITLQMLNHVLVEQVHSTFDDLENVCTLEMTLCTLEMTLCTLEMTFQYHLKLAFLEVLRSSCEINPFSFPSTRAVLTSYLHCYNEQVSDQVHYHRSHQHHPHSLVEIFYRVTQINKSNKLPCIMLPHSRLKPNQISLSNTGIIFFFGFRLICCSLFTSRFSLNFSRNPSSSLSSPDFPILGNCYNSLQFKIGIPTYFRISLYYASIVSYVTIHVILTIFMKP